MKRERYEREGVKDGKEKKGKGKTVKLEVMENNGDSWRDRGKAEEKKRVDETRRM